MPPRLALTPWSRRSSSSAASSSASLPATRQPGPFLVGAEDRSISPRGSPPRSSRQPSCPPHSRILVDRPNGTLLASYGDLDPVFGQINGIPVTPGLLQQDASTAATSEVISDDPIDYIVVDRRLSRDLPVSGYYFEPDEPLQPHEPDQPRRAAEVRPRSTA